MQLGEITGSLYDEDNHLCIGEGTRDVLSQSFGKGRGTGLFVDDLDNVGKRWTIVGVLMVSGIWAGDKEREPGLLTRVDKHLPWIRENM